jgi:hypothetical protein
MAAVIGTPVEVDWAAGATPAAQSVTVPSGATAAYMFWSMYGTGTGDGLASVTLNGNAPDEVFEVPDEASFVMGAGVAVWYEPASGAQNLQPVWDSAPFEGPTTAFVCVEDSNIVGWRDADAANNSTTQQTITLTTLSGDLVLAYDAKFNATPDNEAGYTSLLTVSNNSEFGRLRSIVASGATQAASTQNTDGSGIVAVSIPDAASGAQNAVAWLVA